jgi:hypothetical protein
MARNIEKIAAGLGANIAGQVPETGGGAFGAARLTRLAEQASTDGRKVSPMQIAARILEDALTQVPER